MRLLAPALDRLLPPLVLLALIAAACTRPAGSPPRGSAPMPVDAAVPDARPHAVAPPASPLPLALLTGPSGGAYSPFGHALADVYNATLPDVRVTATTIDSPGGASGNAEAIEAGRAELGFSRADIAFQTFVRAGENGSSGSRLRSMGVIYVNAVHVLVRRASGIRRGEQMRGHRVQVSDDGSPLSRFVIEGHGLTLKDVTAVADPRNAVTRMKANALDVRIFASAYPLAGIDDVGEDSPLALLSLPPAVIDRLRERFPFFKPVSIPKGTYVGQTADVETVGIDGLLLCRDSLPETTVYALTKTLFESLDELASTQPSAKMIDGLRAPATSIPLHPGAARYFRERDLFR